MNKNWIIVGIVAAGMYLFWKSRAVENGPNVRTATPAVLRTEGSVQPTTRAERETRSASAPLEMPAPPRRIQQLPKNVVNKPKNTATYHLDEGLVVVHGDVVIGAPVDENPPATGLVVIPKMDLWPTNVIPYYIQPNVKNPERVLEALEMFRGTAVHFVPYTDQQDALVFEDSVGVCKSYVGRIGGKQPIWIPPGCEAAEVAHEIMHALGFVHEQNRSDRDQFIQVMNDNIKEEFIGNFEMLAPDMMKVSGLDSFDFDSLMIYPPSMFAKNSAPTMVPRNAQAEIRPSPTLSEKDKARINRAFSRGL